MRVLRTQNQVGYRGSCLSPLSGVVHLVGTEVVTTYGGVSLPLGYLGPFILFPSLRT